MLLNFTVENYRSFKYEKTFSMEACSITKHEESVLKNYDERILPLAILYGPNSGGKSNLIDAIATMRNIVLSSVKLNSDDTLPYDPYALSNDVETKPTFFEIEFLKNDLLYRYGFEYNEIEIVSEWLYERDIKAECEENCLFERERNDINVVEETFAEGKGKEEVTNANRLFVSLVAQLKGKKSQAILEWFGNCNILSGIDSTGYEGFTIEMFLKNLEGADVAQDFFKRLKLGFNQLSIKKTAIQQDFLEKLPKLKRMEMEQKMEVGNFVEIVTTHNVYDDDGVVIGEKSFNRELMESEGTKKLIEISGPIFDTLIKGKVLIVDELDAKLHPLLTRSIVLLFMNAQKNKNGAQLIFATHDVKLLDLDIIRRDQIWFAEKDKVESTDLYSLVEFKESDDNNNILQKYIEGRFGAVPFID